MKDVKNNRRQPDGFKHCTDTYRTTKEGQWEQYTDFAGSIEPNVICEAHDLATAKKFIKERAMVDEPTSTFKAQKVYPEGFYRIYRLVK